MKNWMKKLFYDEQLHREVYNAWREYPYGMRNTVVTFLLTGFAFGMVFGYLAGISK